LKRIDPAKTRIRIVPKLVEWRLMRESPGKPWVVDEAGSRSKRGPQAPAAGMSQLAALEYAHWRSLRDRRWRFRLPTDLEWEKAARGVDRRVHVWGNYLVWSFSRCAGGSYPENYYPVAGGQAPFDESVYGVLDLGGSMSEHSSSPISSVNTTLRGANWWATDTQNLRIATRNGRKSDGSGSEAGIRLVAERIEEGE
jgi:formylglycine-generating enzyme required for sulfatase activity